MTNFTPDISLKFFHQFGKMINFFDLIALLTRFFN